MLSQRDRFLDYMQRNPVPGAEVSDTDLSWEAEDGVIRRAADLFADIQGVVEVRNEAREHLWYEQHFGVPAEPFTSTADAGAEAGAENSASPVAASLVAAGATFSGAPDSGVNATLVVP